MTLKVCTWCLSNCLFEIPNGIGPGDTLQVVGEQDCKHPKHTP